MSPLLVGGHQAAVADSIQSQYRFEATRHTLPSHNGPHFVQIHAPPPEDDLPLVRAFRITRPKKRATICTQSSVQIHAPQEGHDLYSVERSDSRAPRRGGTICTQSSVQIHAPQEEGARSALSSSVQIHAPQEEGARSDSSVQIHAPQEEGARSALIQAFRFTRPCTQRSDSRAPGGTICTHSSVQIHAPQEEGARSALIQAFRFTRPKKRGHDLHSFKRSDSRAPRRGPRSALWFRQTMRLLHHGVNTLPLGSDSPGRKIDHDLL